MTEYIAIMWHRRAGYHLIGAASEELRDYEISRIRDYYRSRVTNLYGPVPPGTFMKLIGLMEGLHPEQHGNEISLARILTKNL
jgi:hypothetical protein